MSDIGYSLCPLLFVRDARDVVSLTEFWWLSLREFCSWGRQYLIWFWFKLHNWGKKIMFIGEKEGSAWSMNFFDFDHWSPHRPWLPSNDLSWNVANCSFWSIGPERLSKDTLRNSKKVSCVNYWGIFPDKLLKERSNASRVESFPKECYLTSWAKQALQFTYHSLVSFHLFCCLKYQWQSFYKILEASLFFWRGKNFLKPLLNHHQPFVWHCERISVCFCPMLSCVLGSEENSPLLVL